MCGPNCQPLSGGVSLPSWSQIWAAFIAQLDAVGSELAFIQYARSVERNYHVDADGRLVVNTPHETAELYEMMKAPNRDELDFGL